MNNYNEKYLPSIIRIGRIVFMVSLVLFFTPFLLTWLVMGIEPQWPQIMKAGGTWFAMNIVFWIVEPISFFPVLGIPGSFIGGLAGNGSNLRIPCAVASQKATGTQPGTLQGSAISTIGICISVYVNIIILAIGVLLGQEVLSMLPESITNILNYLLPALYGCVFAEFIGGNEKGGAVAIVLAIGSLLMYRNGMFGFIQADIAMVLPMIIPIFGTLAVLLLLQKKAEGNDTTENSEV